MSGRITSSTPKLSHSFGTLSGGDMAASSSRQVKDWSATQYLKFSEQRTRPSRDLLAQIPISSPRRIIDIGCGPGNSTEALATRWPDAQISGIDSSPNMIETARKALPNLQFSVADLTTYTPEEPADILFSNAVFQWVRSDLRIPAMTRLVRSLKSGGVFAMQVPDNFAEKSHESMRAVAESGPWAETLSPLKPALDPMQSPLELYDALKPLCSSVDLWHTHYQHPLGSHEEIVEWVKGTGLRPFIDPLGPEAKAEFLSAYLQRLKDSYPACADGTVLLRYPRLFLVAVRA